jgi:hypothetical protein
MNVSVIIETSFRVTDSEHPFSGIVDLEEFCLKPRMCHRGCPFDEVRKPDDAGRKKTARRRRSLNRSTGVASCLMLMMQGILGIRFGFGWIPCA